MKEIQDKWKVWLPILLTIFAGLGVSIVVEDSNNDNRPDRTIITIGKKVSPEQPVVVVDKNQELSKGEADAQSEADPTSIGPELHEDAKDETPEGKVLPDPATRIPTEDLVPPSPPAGAQSYSCMRHYVANHAANRARKVQLVLHYTVSKPGSLDAIWRLFNIPSFAASSDWLWEPLTSRCQRIVPPGRYSWTQGRFNSVSESIEIMAMGTESRAFWMDSVIKDGKLAALVADRLKAMGSPPRFVDPKGCTPEAGWSDHYHLECGNDHHDVKPNFPYKEFGEQVKRAYYGANRAAPSLKVLTRSERAAASCLISERRSAKRHGGWEHLRPSHLRRATACKTVLTNRSRELHKLGLTRKFNRSARHEVIHEVV